MKFDFMMFHENLNKKCAVQWDSFCRLKLVKNRDVFISQNDETLRIFSNWSTVVMLAVDDNFYDY